MGRPGVGVMIEMLSGNADSVEAFKAALNKKITELKLDDSALHIEVADGTKVMLCDDGQSCCESRYFRTDDDLPYYVGSELLGAEVVEGEDKDEGGEVHETSFLKVKTSIGEFTIVAHVEHNGYYGGFAIRAHKE